MDGRPLPFDDVQGLLETRDGKLVVAVVEGNFASVMEKRVIKARTITQISPRPGIIFKANFMRIGESMPLK